MLTTLNANLSDEEGPRGTSCSPNESKFHVNKHKKYFNETKQQLFLHESSLLSTYSFQLSHETHQICRFPSTYFLVASFASRLKQPLPLLVLSDELLLS